MKITSLDLLAGADANLVPGQMSPLGDLVVLAGRNGSGKSRILKLVKALLSDKRMRAEQQDRAAMVVQHVPGKTTGERLALVNAQDMLERRALFTVDGEIVDDSVLDFVPKSHSLRDHRTLTEAQQSKAHQALKSLGIDDIEENALSYLANVERRAFAASHPALRGHALDREKAIAERDRLAQIIQDFLGVAPSLNFDQQPQLFDRPVSEANLSHGQSLLLQLAVAVHAQGARLDGLVLLLDEPECHLHPAAIVEAIDRLRSLNKLGQIWIATHCVPVLAAVPPDSIWYVSDGAASWAGRRPEVVLEGLLGGPTGRERMAEFLRLPAQFASNRFAAECLVAPSAVMTGADDPQAQHVRELCQAAVIVATRPLRVLDYGAGQGRLLSAMKERWQVEDKPFDQCVDYRAFEPDPRYVESLEGTVAEAYRKTDPRRILKDRDQLQTLDENSFDVVLLCNVLHEIPPDEWRHLFGAEGAATRLLAPSDHLIILEDMELPHGERAHRFGFLLLDRPHLHKLLSCREADQPIETVSARDGRLKVHVVPAALLGKTNHDTTAAALKLLKETARREVLRIRGEPPDSRSGRLHAMWTQLLANSEIALHELG